MAKRGLVELIDPVVWNEEWIVNCQAVGSPEASLKYLAPYVFRVAISDRSFQFWVAYKKVSQEKTVIQ